MVYDRRGRSKGAPTVVGHQSSRQPRRSRICIGISRSIANSFSFLVDESQRLLEQRRLWSALGHGSFHDVETVFVHMNRRESAGSIGVGELQLMSFNQVQVVIGVKGDLGVSLKKMKRRPHDRSSQIIP